MLIYDFASPTKYNNVAFPYTNINPITATNTKTPKDSHCFVQTAMTIHIKSILLNSPTTTYHDKFVVNELSKQNNIDYNDYGIKLLKSGMDLAGFSVEDIIYRDYKTYNVNGYKFSIGQILTVDFSDIENKKEEYIEALNEISIKNGYRVCALYVTNILDKNSYILYNDSAEYIMKEAYALTNIYQGIVLDGVLSRKKQMVPNIMDILERL